MTKSQAYTEAAKFLCVEDNEWSGCCHAISLASGYGYKIDGGGPRTNLELLGDFWTLFQGQPNTPYWFGSRDSDKNRLARTLALLLMAELTLD